MRFFYLFSLWLLCLHANSQNYQVSQIYPVLLQNADAVVRHDKMNILVKSYDHMEISLERVVTVLNNNGKKHLNTYVFYDEATKIKNLSAVVLDENGRELETFK
ncbi:MAG: DUF3857 domain-containing protein, partial [Maribacter sp.]